MAEEVKVSGKSAEIIEAIKVMTVIELADLVKALEEKFGLAFPGGDRPDDLLVEALGDRVRLHRRNESPAVLLVDPTFDLACGVFHGRSVIFLIYITKIVMFMLHRQGSG